VLVPALLQLLVANDLMVHIAYSILLLAGPAVPASTNTHSASEPALVVAGSGLLATQHSSTSTKEHVLVL
jgi:hypothetical protein